MKIGVFTVLFGQQSRDQAFDYIVESGVQAVELGTGNYPGGAHADLDNLLSSESARKDLLKAVESRGLVISALSCHGNSLHPDERIAKEHHETRRKTIQLAEMLGITRVIDFSGCPGDGPNATKPNWVTCPWPPDFLEILQWQWKEKVIPYWGEEAKFAEKHGVKICFEMHPGFVVYNPETLMCLRDAVAIRELGSAIYHFHAKDTKIDEQNTRKNGVLDTKPYSDEIHRSWLFRTIGYGHGPQVWKDMISNLRMVGYDDVLSIEHEDSLMSVNEGFQKAVAFLKHIVIEEEKGAMWWA
jgi:sugar phosphate isomerase/epimerase